jgi:hypothetical protein
MMIIFITSLMIMSSVVGGDGCGRGRGGGFTVCLSGSNFCRRTAYPDLLFVLFVSPSRKRLSEASS